MILVLTPMDCEFTALKKHFFRNRGVHIELGGHGKVQFALNTLTLAKTFRPQLIICAGACGGIDPQVNLFDIIAAHTTIEHDYNLKFWKAALPNFPGCMKSVVKLTEYKPEVFKLHIGIMASGDEDVIDKARAKQIQYNTGALGVAWEGAGGARAAAMLKVPFLELRVATDSANETAAQDFEKNVDIGMGNIAQVIRYLL